MSPVLKRKKEKFRLPSKYLLFILTVLCIAIMVLSFTTNILSVPLNYVSSFFVVPFENGLTSVGTYALEKTQQLEELSSVLEENEKLKSQINELTIENTQLQQEKYELTKLRELYALDAEYEEYSKIGTRIISRDPGNWYSSFVIDKGTEDGIAVNCNVIAGSGLVGRVIDEEQYNACITAKAEVRSSSVMAEISSSEYASDRLAILMKGRL